MSIRDSTPSLPETSENFLKLYEINFLEENFAGEKERGRKFDLPPFDWNSICGRVLPSRTPSAQLFHRHFRSRGLVTPRPMLIPARSSPFDRLFRASPNGFNKISLRFYLSYPTSFPPLPVPQFSLSLSLSFFIWRTSGSPFVHDGARSSRVPCGKFDVSRFYCIEEIAPARWRCSLDLPLARSTIASFPRFDPTFDTSLGLCSIRLQRFLLFVDVFACKGWFTTRSRVSFGENLFRFATLCRFWLDQICDGFRFFLKRVTVIFVKFFFLFFW